MPDRASIEAMVPQRGDMCLLHAVTGWDASQIECTAPAPRATHPLAREGIVPSIMACEYAAQAAAVHGSLLEPGGDPVDGLMAKIMDVELSMPALPFDKGPLTVQAHVISRLDSGCLYSFEVRAGAMPLASGRVMVAFERSTP